VAAAGSVRMCSYESRALAHSPAEKWCSPIIIQASPYSGDDGYSSITAWNWAMASASRPPSLAAKPMR